MDKVRIRIFQGGYIPVSGSVTQVEDNGKQKLFQVASIDSMEWVDTQPGIISVTLNGLFLDETNSPIQQKVLVKQLVCNIRTMLKNTDSDAVIKNIKNLLKMYEGG